MHRFVYFAHDALTPAELSAARLDGHLVELGEGYVPADAVESPALRAASLRVVLRDVLAATHLTAAWVHGARDEPPARLDVQRASRARLHHVLDRRLTYREMRMEPLHLQRIGGVLVTSPARTLADLTRESVRRGTRPGVEEAIRGLLGAPGAARAAIVVLAYQNSVPGKRAAMARLRSIERENGRQDDVTRYTS